MTQLFKRPSFKHDRQILLDHLKKADKDVLFGQTPIELLDDSQATSTDKVIFARLHAFCLSKQLSECPKCQVPIETICKRVNRTEDVVRKSLKRMNRLGWILTIRVGRTLPNKYTLFPHNKKRIRKLKKDLKAIDYIKRELSIGKSNRFERIRKQVAASQSHCQYEELNIPEVEVLEDIANRTFYKLSPEERTRMEKIWTRKDEDLHSGYLQKKRISDKS